MKLEQSSSYKALLNEYKGSLFEFLVGLEFARNYDLEMSYLDQCHNIFGNILEQQESYVRHYYPYLLELLPQWSKQLVDDFLQLYPVQEVQNIRMVGKQFAGRTDGAENEADILLITPKKTLPLSIKLAKGHSFVNTKSSGVKSFFKKNFSALNGGALQQVFNHKYEQFFEEFAMKMHSEAGLTYQENFIRWEEEGLPVLPGKLSNSYRKFLLNFYKNINREISETLYLMWQGNPEVFYQALWPLMGFSQINLVQLTAFHQEKSKDAHRCKTSVKKMDKKLIIRDFEVKEHSLSLSFDNAVLQLRLKPMNKFTASAYKVNCSVKQL